VTNRLYVASGGVAPGPGSIAYVNLDGSGGGTFVPPPAAPVGRPEGIALDPATRTVYWLNQETTPATISWARLDGSAGGVLEHPGATIEGAYRLALDPSASRIYWGNSDGSLAYAKLDGSGGEMLLAHGSSEITGVAVDPAAGRIYWSELGALPGEGALFFAPLGSVGTTEIGAATAPVKDPWGVAFDPALGRLYWANFGNEKQSTGAIGFADLAGGAGAVSPVSAPVDAPQDPVIIKSPSGTAAPQLTFANGQLQCSQGSWGPDYVASSVYQSPRSFTFQWTLNGSPVTGATGTSYAPSTSGSYACVVTATNQAGSSSQTSSATAVKVSITTRPGKTVTRQEPQRKPAKLQLLGKARHLKARPGKLLTLRIRSTNQGTVPSNPAKLCLKLTKGAKRALRAGRCQRLGALKGGATEVAKLRLRVKRKAEPGLYKLRISLPGDQTKVTVRVLH